MFANLARIFPNQDVRFNKLLGESVVVHQGAAISRRCKSLRAACSETPDATVLGGHSIASPVCLLLNVRYAARIRERVKLPVDGCVPRNASQNIFRRSGS